MINLLNKEGVIKKGLEKYVGKIPGTASINELQKNYPFGNSSHPQKGSVNQVNCSVSWLGPGVSETK